MLAGPPHFIRDDLPEQMNGRSERSLLTRSRTPPPPRTFFLLPGPRTNVFPASTWNFYGYGRIQEVARLEDAACVGLILGHGEIIAVAATVKVRETAETLSPCAKRDPFT